MESQNTQIVKTMLRKSKAKDITLPKFKLYYRAILLITYGFGIKNKHVYQWNRIKSHK